MKKEEAVKLKEQKERLYKERQNRYTQRGDPQGETGQAQAWPPVVSVNNKCVNAECEECECLVSSKCTCKLSKPGKLSNPKQTSFKCDMKNFNGLNVIYTNTDVLHNKLEELELTAKNEKADIIAVTEILLKNMPPFTKPEDFVFKIKG